MRRALYNLAWWLCLAACGAGCSSMPKGRSGAKPGAPTADKDKGADAKAKGTADGATGTADEAKRTPAASSSAPDAAGGESNASSTSEAVKAAANSSRNSATGKAPTNLSPSDSDQPASEVAAARPAAADPQALLAAIAELQAIGAIDPDAQQRLIADLKQTDPALWPQLLQYLKSSIASYKRPAQRADASGEEVESTALASSRKRGAVADHAVQPAGEPVAVVSPPAELPPSTVIPASAELPAQSPAAGPASSSAPPSAASSSPALVSSRAVQIANPLPAQSPSSPAQAAPQTAPPATPAASPQAAGPAAPDDDNPNAWEDHLHAAVAGLENLTSDPPQSAAETSRHAALRMLYVIQGRREDALRPISGIAPSQQDFWSQEIYGLSNYLDTERNPDSSRRAAEAVDRLREAAAKLGEQATLSVKNLTFCTEVTSYGVYKAFSKNEFRAGQEVLLYAEVENFKSRHNDKGYETALRSSYQILDQHGARVDSQEFEVTQEHCQNLRRDYFLRYHIWMPKRVYGGNYTLQLTIEDTLSQKLGQSSLEFSIKE